VIHVNVMGNKGHFDRFCASMDKLFQCRTRHCELTCWAQAMRDVQTRCNKGASIEAAARKWAETGLTHKAGEEILAGILGVKDMGALRKYLSGETA
jgi:hypothetical protein